VPNRHNTAVPKGLKVVLLPATAILCGTICSVILFVVAETVEFAMLSYIYTSVICCLEPYTDLLLFREKKKRLRIQFSASHDAGAG
jgi:hypothetical protein